MDADWQYIVFEFVMNYTEESLRNGVLEEKKRKSQLADAETMRMLGYSDNDILNRKE